MSSSKLAVGIIGLPNAGKSTLFNSLAARRLAETSPRPFTTISPHEAVVPVPDANLERLASAVSGGHQLAPSIVPATVKFIDIAGLVKGAHKGEGLGNQFLAKIREVDMVVHVINAYTSRSADELVDDYKVIRTELALADLQSLERISSKQLNSNPDLKILVAKLAKLLNTQKPIDPNSFSSQERDALNSLFLLSIKPELVIFNCNESTEKNTSIDQIKTSFPDALFLSARFAEDLIDLDEDDRREFLREFGLTDSAISSLVTACYALLGLITFYTIKGGTQITAWSIGEGSNALDAAFRVHTDFGNNFIKAEVISVPELLNAGSWRNAKEKGSVRLEGKDYGVQDGDVIECKVKA